MGSDVYGTLVVTGAAVWVAIVIAFLWMAFEIIIVGATCAISIARWDLATMRKHGRKPRWTRLPSQLWHDMWRFAGHRNTGSVTLHKGSASWRGIGDWTA